MSQCQFGRSYPSFIGPRQPFLYGGQSTLCEQPPQSTLDEQRQPVLELERADRFERIVPLTAFDQAQRELVDLLLTDADVPELLLQEARQSGWISSSFGSSRALQSRHASESRSTRSASSPSTAWTSAGVSVDGHGQQHEMLLYVRPQLVEEFLRDVVEQRRLRVGRRIHLARQQRREPDHRRPAVGKRDETRGRMRLRARAPVMLRRASLTAPRHEARRRRRTDRSRGVTQRGRSRPVSRTCVPEPATNRSRTRTGAGCGATSSYSSITSHVSSGQPSSSSTSRSATTSGSSSGVLSAERSSRVLRSIVEDRGARACETASERRSRRRKRRGALGTRAPSARAVKSTLAQASSCRNRPARRAG